LVDSFASQNLDNVGSREEAAVDIEKLMMTIRAGGNDASLAFFKIAVDAFQRRGGRGLAVWVREAFRELPVEDQNVLVVIGLEARIKEMGITENRRS
jgi:hypothetical protein